MEDFREEEYVVLSCQISNMADITDNWMF